ncbi:MAG: hypothetical protein WB471_13935 [Nocardioides sp.]
MSNPVKAGAVRFIKPLLSDSMWARATSVAKRSAGTEAIAPAGAGSSTSAVSPPSEKQLRRQRRQAMDLTELAQEFGTDKFGTHRYTPRYQQHLEHLRDREFTMLEIGIGGYSREGKGGASLRMWKHFFPKAQILGLDIHDKSFVNAPRITAIQGSQVDEALLHRIVEEHGPIEVIIDDGSHRPHHIRETFRILFPLLAPDGIYAIEDIQTSYWPEWGGSEDRQDPTTTLALVKDLVDGLNYEEFVDEPYEPTYSDLHVVGVHAYHNLVIIEKGENQEGTNKRRVLKARYASSDDRPATPST